MTCSIFQWSVETDVSIRNLFHGFTPPAAPRMEFPLRRDVYKNVQRGWADDGNKFALDKCIHHIMEIGFACHKHNGQVIYWEHGRQLVMLNVSNSFP